MTDAICRTCKHARGKHTPAGDCTVVTCFCTGYSIPNTVQSVEISRYDERILTVTRGDGASFNCDNRLLEGIPQHNGVWDSQKFRFVPKQDCFSDGTPIGIYEGQQIWAK